MSEKEKSFVIATEFRKDIIFLVIHMMGYHVVFSILACIYMLIEKLVKFVGLNKVLVN